MHEQASKHQTVMSAVYLYGIWFLKGLREYTSSGFQAASHAFEPLDGISVRGRSYMITGANSGIGRYKICLKVEGKKVMCMSFVSD